MHKSKKIITWTLVILGVVAAAIFIAASVYINKFKPQLEELLTRNIGMQTVIDGAISLKVMPGLSFSAHKVKVVNNETYVLRIEKIEIAVDYTKIFSETIHIKELHFKRPQLFILRDLDGSYNFEVAMASVNPDEASGMANHKIDLSELTVMDASILYIDNAFEDTLQVEGIYLDSEEVGLQGSLDKFEPHKIKLTGDLRIDQFKLNNLMIDSMFFEVKGDKGLLRIEEQSKPFMGGEISGDILFDFNKEPVLIQNRHNVKNLDLKEFFHSIGSRPYLTGFADYQLNLSFSSFRWETAMKTMNGNLDLQGQNMEMHGMDLHGMIGKLSSAQYFNSLDLMAIFLAGPYGAVFSKGMDFKQLVTGDTNDITPIRKMNSSWKIDKGIATTEDVAFNTGLYRVALNGRLNLSTDHYEDLEIAILTRNGCAAFSQILNGPFMEPDTEGMLNLGLLKGPLDNLPEMLSRSTHMECIPFYTGNIEHP